MREGQTLLSGTLRVRIEGDHPQLLLNELVRENISFSDVRFQEGGSLGVTVPIRAESRLRHCAEKNQCTVTVAKRKGVGVWARHLKRRIALIIGCLLFFLAVGLFGFTLITVSVEGNETISDGQILSRLHDLGLQKGKLTLTMDEATMARELLMQMPDLTWCAINFHGTHADVLVREEYEKPELYDESLHGDIYADASGVIEQIDVYAGKGQVDTGAVIAAGDLLISGTFGMQFPQYSQLEGTEYHRVRAAGEITARTWRTISASIPLEYEGKIPTGEETVRYALIFPGTRLNFCQNGGISYVTCDKITKVYSVDWLPVQFIRETSRQYTTQRLPVNRENAVTLLKEQLMASLQMTIGEEGEVIATTFSVKEENALLTVTVVGECREKIGVFKAYD